MQMVRGEWKWKKEIYNKLKCVDILTVNKVLKLEWIWRVRKDGKGMIKKIMEGKSGGGRRNEDTVRGR
jgi:hypothetical protein